MAGSKIVRKPESSGPVLERHPLDVEAAADLGDHYAEPDYSKANSTTPHDGPAALVDTSGQIDYEQDANTVRTDPAPALVDNSQQWQEPSVGDYRNAGYESNDSGSQIKADSATPPGEVRLVEHYNYGTDDGLTPNERAQGMRPKNEANVEVVGTVRTETTAKNVAAAPKNKAASVGADK